MKQNIIIHLSFLAKILVFNNQFLKFYLHNLKQFIIKLNMY